MLMNLSQEALKAMGLFSSMARKEIEQRSTTKESDAARRRRQRWTLPCDETITPMRPYEKIIQSKGMQRGGGEKLDVAVLHAERA